MSPVLAVLVSEVGEGDQDDEDDEADGQTDQQSDVVHRGVELIPSTMVTELRGWMVHGHQVLVAQVTVRAAGDVGAEVVCDLAVSIIREGKIPSDWERSFIVCVQG